MKKNASILLLFLIVVGCNTINQDSKDQVFIDLDGGVKENFSTFFSSIDYILLDIPDTVPLTGIWNVQIEHEKIFVSDRTLNNLLIFGIDGNFQRIIQSSGSGPGEFQLIEDFHVFDSKIHILDKSLKRILSYDYEGNFLNSYSIDVFPQNFFINQTGYLFYFGNSVTENGNTVISSIGQKTTGLKKIIKDFENLTYSSPYGFGYDSFNDQVYLKLDTSYEVLFFDKALRKVDEVKFDFGKYNYPEDLRKQFFMDIERYKFLEENSMVENIFSFIPLSKHHLMILNQVGKSSKSIFFKRDFSELLVVDELINDYDGFQGNFSPVFQQDSHLVQIKASTRFYNEYIKSFQGKKIDRSFLSDSTSVHGFFSTYKEKLTKDNYVIMRSKIKN